MRSRKKYKAFSNNESAIISYTSNICGVCVFNSSSFQRLGNCFSLVSAPPNPCFCISISHTLQSIRQQVIRWAVTHTRNRCRAITLSSFFMVSNRIRSTHSRPFSSSFGSTTKPCSKGSKWATCCMRSRCFSCNTDGLSSNGANVLSGVRAIAIRL